MQLHIKIGVDFVGPLKPTKKGNTNNAAIPNKEGKMAQFLYKKGDRNHVLSAFENNQCRQESDTQGREDNCPHRPPPDP